MARGNQAKSLALVLAHEGGFSNHPDDPGGATMRGVTQAVYDATRQSRFQAAQSVRHITADEIASIYDQQYWDRANCDRLPHGLDYAVFDYAVNSGVSRAGKDLQRVLGVNADGVIGVGIARIATCRSELAGARISINNQNEAIDQVVRSAAEAKARSEARIKAAEAETRAAQRRAQTIRNFQPQDGETQCEAAFRLHQETAQ